MDQLGVLRAHEHVHVVVRLRERLIQRLHVARGHRQHALQDEVLQAAQVGEVEEEVGEGRVRRVLREPQLVLAAKVQRGDYG